MARTILIFGGTGGIGAVLARRLATEGARIHLAARDRAKLDALAEDIRATSTAGDVLDPGFLEQAAREAAGDGPLDGLVYAVGTIDLKPIDKLDAEEAVRAFRINALGAAEAIKAALPALRQSEAASVVLFSTVAVAQGFASHVEVAMAKGAVEGLVRTLAAELAPTIRINAVAPSLTDTPLAASAGLTSAEAMKKAIAAMHPIPRLGRPEDAAAAAAFLLSPDAGWITGQVIGVDGGRSTLRVKG